MVTMTVPLFYLYKEDEWIRLHACCRSAATFPTEAAGVLQSAFIGRGWELSWCAETDGEFPSRLVEHGELRHMVIQLLSGWDGKSLP